MKNTSYQYKPYNQYRQNYNGYSKYSIEQSEETPLIIKVILGSAISFLVIVLLILNSTTNSKNSELITEFKEGTATLSCLIGNESSYRDINPDKILDRRGSSWIFTNGSAKNCIVKR